MLLGQARQHVLCRLSLQTPQHRRDFYPLHMPDPQRLIRADDHLGFIHETIAQHRRPFYLQCGKICLGVGCLAVRPMAPCSPKRLLRPALFFGVEIPANARKAHKQLLDPLLVKALGQGRSFRFTQERVDHRRCLQRR